MKIVLTGHTSGLGKALYNDFVSRDLEVFGASRSSGIDINNDTETLCRLYFDVFINNAHSGFGQTKLLQKVFKANRDRPCQIINIGSVSGDNAAFRNEINEYAIEKSTLEITCQQLQYQNSKCKVILIKPGRIDTPMVEHKDVPKMSTTYVVNVINWIISQPTNIIVKNLTIDSA